MSFLYIPKNGDIRFHSGDPFEFVKKKKMIVVNNYFKFFDADAILTYTTISEGENCFYGMMVVNEDGSNFLNDGDDVNKIAESLVGTYVFSSMDFGGVHSDAILVKLDYFDNLLDISSKDKEEIKRLISDADECMWYMEKTK